MAWQGESRHPQTPTNSSRLSDTHLPGLSDTHLPGLWSFRHAHLPGDFQAPIFPGLQSFPGSPGFATNLWVSGFATNLWVSGFATNLWVSGFRPPLVSTTEAHAMSISGLDSTALGLAVYASR